MFRPPKPVRPPERVLVSACLLGRECRYDGCHNEDGQLQRELTGQGLVVVPFCPEEQGGLPTPRPAAWITEGGAEAVLDGQAGLVDENGLDVTEAFLRGARAALETCRSEGIRRAFLKERSPSCGRSQTHVGGVLTAGPGVTAALLIREGLAVKGVEGRRP